MSGEWDIKNHAPERVAYEIGENGFYFVPLSKKGSYWDNIDLTRKLFDEVHRIEFEYAYHFDDMGYIYLQGLDRNLKLNWLTGI